MQRRSTRQRDTVYRALTQLYHPTAEEVYEYLCQSGEPLGRATVFRNLTVLAEEGRVHRLTLPKEGTRYDPVIDGHAHFSCRGCGCIIDLPPLLERPSLFEGSGCLIEACTVNCFGLCPSCQKPS